VEDVRLANVMGARTNQSLWHNIVGRSIANIPSKFDLVTMPERIWKSCQPGLRQVLQGFLNNPGIACAALTKALHRKRPAFLPVCDSVIINDLLHGSSSKSSDTILGIMQIFREVGINNLANLQQVRDFLVKENGLPDLTNVRTLEVLYWMENIERYKMLWSYMERLGWWR